METSRNYLQGVLQSARLQEVPLLIYLNNNENKELVRELNLHAITDREVHIQSCNTATGQGVNVGFDWLSKMLAKKGPQYSFEAEPKVVKGRPKYNSNNEENVSKS